MRFHSPTVLAGFVYPALVEEDIPPEQDTLIIDFGSGRVLPIPISFAVLIYRLGYLELTHTVLDGGLVESRRSYCSPLASGRHLDLKIAGHVLSRLRQHGGGFDIDKRLFFPFLCLCERQKKAYTTDSSAEWNFLGHTFSMSGIIEEWVQQSRIKVIY